MKAQLLPHPRGQLVVKILRGIGKCSEYQYLPVAGIEWVAHFFRDHFSQRGEFRVAGRTDLVGSEVERRETFAVFIEILFPADKVYVLDQHLHLSPNEQTLERGIVNLHILDVDFFDGLLLCFDLRKRDLHVVELTFWLPEPPVPV